MNDNMHEKIFSSDFVVKSPCSSQQIYNTSANYKWCMPKANVG